MKPVSKPTSVNQKLQKPAAPPNTCQSSPAHKRPPQGQGRSEQEIWGEEEELTNGDDQWIVVDETGEDNTVTNTG